MKAVSISEIRKELESLPNSRLIELCLRLGRFKKENKELLTYLLIESLNENEYIQGIKADVELDFKTINTSSYYLIKKSVRRILKRINTFIRYSNKTETEIELLLMFCMNLKKMRPAYTGNIALVNLYNRQIEKIHKTLPKLHEDLQYDYNQILINI